MQDTIYNWLSIKVVSDARPDDSAAAETVGTFYRILEEEYKVSSIRVKKEEELYYISCLLDGVEQMYRFPRELIDCMLDSINENPERYKNYE